MSNYSVNRLIGDTRQFKQKRAIPAKKSEKLMVSYVEERPWRHIQSPQNGSKKKFKGREIRSSLVILDLKDGRLQDSGKQEEGKAFHKY